MKIFDNHRITDTKVRYSGPWEGLHRTTIMITLSNGSIVAVNLDELKGDAEVKAAAHLLRAKHVPAGEQP